MTRRLIDAVARNIPLPADRRARAEKLVDTEWLVTNGLGGYSSSSVACANTRRYHGILVAALPNPLGRMMMLSRLDETIGGATGARASIHEGDAASRVIRAFRLEAGLPVWEYACDGVIVEKRIWMPHGQNTTLVQYRLLDGKLAALELRPVLHFRGYEDSVDSTLPVAYLVENDGPAQRVQGDDRLPPLRMLVENERGEFVSDPRRHTELDFPVEAARGYTHRGSAWSPGHYRAELRGDAPVVLIASTERPDEIAALPSGDARAC